MNRLGVLLLLALASCQKSPAPADAGAPDGCAILFGNPVEATGLSSDQCRPFCACGGTLFQPPVYDAQFIQSLLDDWHFATPFPSLASDPYQQAAPPADPPDTVCAVVPVGDPAKRPRDYQLQTFSSMDLAKAAGAHPTHYGHCGVCSTLANLAVYLRENDLGKPVRSCAFATDTDGGDPDVYCLEKLGFDLPCAQIWSFNTKHTSNACLQPCVANFTAPYNLPDGTLNPCLQCDEDQSGPVFKGVAGRTRRNSGVPNAICRPCSEVQPLVHDYPP